MVPASAPGFFCSNLVPSSEAVSAVFEPPRTRRRVLRFSCCRASIPLQCCVACPGLSDKASRPPSLAEWTADGNARAPAHFCACPHRIRHSGCVPVQAQLLDQQGPGPNIITSKIFQTAPYMHVVSSFSSSSCCRGTQPEGPCAERQHRSRCVVRSSGHPLQDE